MKNLFRISAVVLAVMLVGAALAEAVTYGGHATGAQVTVPATGTVIRAASGTLSISGGAADAALLVGDIPGSATGGVVSLAAGTMHSSAVGLLATRTEASMADISLTVSGNQITADFIMARSAASCGPAVAGSSQLANLVINGQSITVTGQPNQTVTLSNGTVIINQHVSSVVGTSAELTVNALHVTTRDPVTSQELADVVLAGVDAKIDCQGGGGSPEDFTTGGGWFPVSGGKATFGVHAGIRQDGTFSGHLVYKDHAIDFRVESTAITGYTRNGCMVTITGQGNSNIGPVQFTVDVLDGGEPGSNDEFNIAVTPPGYLEGGTLSGGNIQVHRESC